MNTDLGISLDRVVAIIADLDNDLKQIGSGYLVGNGQVLTAEHCTRDKEKGIPARSLQVVRASDGRSAAARVRVASSEADVAALELVEGQELGELPPPVYGRIDRTRSGEVRDCEAVGYPLWQFDSAAGQRGTAELRGTIRRTDDADVGYLLLRDSALDTVAAPVVAAVGDLGSPWGGLSGALVFQAGVALGVVVKHDPRQGAAAIRLVPFDRIAARSDEATKAVADALSLPSVAGLRLVTVDESAAPLEDLTEWLADGDFPLVADLNPYKLGSTSSNYGNPSSYGQGDPYVPRRIDQELRDALEPGRPLVIVVGPSKAGKTRTAFEALLQRMPQARLVIPVVGKLAQLASHPRLRDTTELIAVWLNDVNLFLNGTDPLTLAMLARLTARPGPTVVVATLQKKERDRLRDATGELSHETSNLLHAAITIELDSTAEDPDEQAAARMAYPDEDLSDVGLAERLANAPELLGAYRDAVDASSPLRYLLVGVAIDWARVGGPSPIPEPDLLALAKEALWQDRPDLDPGEQETSQALNWARTPLSGSAHVAMLSTKPLPGRVRGYWPFSYLVAADDGQAPPFRPIPAWFWQQVLDRVSSLDAFAVGVSGYNRGSVDVAFAAYRKAAEGGSTMAMSNLGVLLMDKEPPDLAAARALCQMAADAGNASGMVNLGIVLTRQDPPDVEGARAWFQKAADVGEPGGMVNLGVLRNLQDPPEPSRRPRVVHEGCRSR